MKLVFAKLLLIRSALTFPTVVPSSRSLVAQVRLNLILQIRYFKDIYLTCDKKTTIGKKLLKKRKNSENSVF